MESRLKSKGLKSLYGTLIIPYPFSQIRSSCSEFSEAAKKGCIEARQDLSAGNSCKHDRIEDSKRQSIL